MGSISCSEETFGCACPETNKERNSDNRRSRNIPEKAENSNTDEDIPESLLSSDESSVNNSALNEKTMQLFISTPNIETANSETANIEPNEDNYTDMGMHNMCPVESHKRLSKIMVISNRLELEDRIRSSYDNDSDYSHSSIDGHEESSLDEEERKEVADMKAYEQLKSGGTKIVKIKSLYRKGTEHPWGHEELEDLHIEMRQQFEAMKEQASPTTQQLIKSGTLSNVLGSASDDATESDSEDIVDMHHLYNDTSPIEHIDREKEDMTRHMIHLVQLQQSNK